MAKEEKPKQTDFRTAPTNIEDEMKTSYIDYAMSVIVGRAIPDVRDGLKPVHRRVLYTIDEMGLAYNKPYKKSARVVGDVLGKYHPHGDLSVYDALVRMVQDFSLRYPLIDGQGNFGSVDGDSPAAMRYTEVRPARITDELITDIDKETVDFVPNYDGSLREPSILPARLPNLLINGSSGIAVGMATNIPPHNITEVCDATMAVIENPEIEIKELSKFVKGPDFPTGGIILGKQGIKDYFEKGRGSVRVRAKTEIEDIKGGRQAIIVNELPYQVNKAVLLESIAELVRDKKITEISDLRDESNREGIRMVIEIKRDGNAQIVLNQLYKMTQLETSFGVIMLALAGGKPKVLSLKDTITHYLAHRQEVVIRRTQFELAKAEARAHILEALRIAIDHLDEVIKIIRQSKDTPTAREKLIARFEFSQIQAQAILDMRLHQLTNLEREALENEYKELIKTIARLKGILADPKKVMAIIREELTAIRDKYGDKRRTQIQASFEEFDVEDLIADEEVVVTISHTGYVKRLPADTYRAQGRGGRGLTGMTTKEEDFVEQVFVTSTLAHLLLFTSRGRVYGIRVYEIPDAGRTARGKAMANFIPIESTEKITAAIAIRSFSEGTEGFLTLCTRGGQIKKTPITEFDSIRKSGIIAMGLDEGDILIGAKLVDGKKDILLATSAGMSIRFPESEIRAMGRGAGGVRGIKLETGDQVVGLEVVDPKEEKNLTLLTTCEFGYGKRTELSEYRDQSRGGKGVITIKATDRNGPVVGIRLVTDKDDVMIMTEKGMAIRLHCKDLSVISRNTQGVRLVRLEEGDKVAAIASVVSEVPEG
ncbi:MAG: DNA gyrase subunit A [Elusimicrobia bacterium]|nr:DNA gyrase subunit A [Elusimicrobiota bacterium]